MAMVFRIDLSIKSDSEQCFWNILLYNFMHLLSRVFSIFFLGEVLKILILMELVDKQNKNRS